MNGLYNLHFSRTARTPKSNNAYVNKWTKEMRSAFEDNTLSGILDTLKEVVNPYIYRSTGKIKQEFQNQIESAQRRLEDKVGQFLSSNQKIADLKTRAQVQRNSPKPEVAQRATAIEAKANALLNQYSNIRGGAIDLANQLNTLKIQLASDPVFKFDNPMSMGTRVIELFNKYRSTLAQALSNSAQMIVRIDNHLKETRNLEGDVSSLESYAQGTGWRATLGTIGSSYMSLTGSLAKIALVGGLVYLMAPTFISRMRKT